MMADNAALNRALAKHLFGWGGVVILAGGDLLGTMPGAQQGDYTDLAHCPDWAGTWAGMGEVVAAMQAQVPPFKTILEWLPSRGYSINVDTHERREAPLQWSAAFYRSPILPLDSVTDCWRGHAVGDEAPECVARAALRALGVKQEEGDGG